MKILLIGLGGFGINLINDIKNNLDEQIDYAIVTKDDSFEHCKLKPKIELNENMLNEIDNLIVEYDKVFIASGLSGRSSKNLVQIAEHIYKNKKEVEVIVNKPFTWEGKERMLLSESIISKLIEKYIPIKIFNNDDILEHIEKEPIGEAFKIYSDSIYQYIFLQHIY